MVEVNMGEYSVGIATKNKIYAEARRLFYHKGIKATSYKDICDAAEVNRGLIPYYFKSKDNLASLVLTDFFVNMERAVDERWGDLEPPVRSSLIEVFLFRVLESNEAILRFYGEVYSTDAFRAVTVEEEREVVRQLCAGAGVSVTPEAAETVARMINGTEGELVCALMEGVMLEPLEVYVRRDLLACFFLLGVESERARVWIDRGFEISQGYTMTCDEEFTCKIVEE